MTTIINEHDQKTINCFERAYVKKQAALETIKNIDTAFAQELGLHSWIDLYDSKRYTREELLAVRAKHPAMTDILEGAQRILMSSNRILKKTKYVFWSYYPKGSAKIIAAGYKPNFI